MRRDVAYIMYGQCVFVLSSCFYSLQAPSNRAPDLRMAMDLEEAVQKLLPIPVIPRLDRIDLLLSYLEEKHTSYAADDTVGKLQVDQFDARCRPLASVLDEVPVKGSLMERVASLEHRMIKLTIELDERERLQQQSFRDTAQGCCCDQVKQREAFDSAGVTATAADGTHKDETALEKQSEAAPVCMRNKRTKRKMQSRMLQMMLRHRGWMGCFRARI